LSKNSLHQELAAEYEQPGWHKSISSPPLLSSEGKEGEEGRGYQRSPKKNHELDFFLSINYFFEATGHCKMKKSFVLKTRP
jgi:hypothetical protein